MANIKVEETVKVVIELTEDEATELTKQLGTMPEDGGITDKIFDELKDLGYDSDED